ncbi:MAG: NlpC/P60 family protein, partial [Campylobacterales bacterium]|nr:NlpC/P60 family protein [Campylobacterales bacterium]
MGINVLIAGATKFGVGTGSKFNVDPNQVKNPTAGYEYNLGGKGSNIDHDPFLEADCSYLVSTALKDAGYNISAFGTHDVYDKGSLTSFATKNFDTISTDKQPTNLQPGDLILLKQNTGGGQHIVIFSGYTADGKIIFYGSQGSTGPAFVDTSLPGKEAVWITGDADTNPKGFQIVASLRPKASAYDPSYDTTLQQDQTPTTTPTTNQQMLDSWNKIKKYLDDESGNNTNTQKTFDPNNIEDLRKFLNKPRSDASGIDGISDVLAGAENYDKAISTPLASSDDTQVGQAWADALQIRAIRKETISTELSSKYGKDVTSYLDPETGVRYLVNSNKELLATVSKDTNGVAIIDAKSGIGFKVLSDGTEEEINPLSSNTNDYFSNLVNQTDEPKPSSDTNTQSTSSNTSNTDSANQTPGTSSTQTPESQITTTPNTSAFADKQFTTALGMQGPLNLTPVNLG